MPPVKTFDVEGRKEEMVLRFNGRTIIAQMAISNTIDIGRFGNTLRALASGPLGRMTGVFQLEKGDFRHVAVIVNTDEPVEEIKQRILVGVSGDPNLVECREAEEAEIGEIWKIILQRVRDEQQN